MYAEYAPIYQRAGLAWPGLQLWNTIRAWLAAQGWHGHHVADWGCGTGELACELAAQGLDVAAIDQSAAMLACARTLPGAAAVRWQQAALEDWRSPMPLDLIVSVFDTFNYLTSVVALEAACHNAARNLAPGGYLVFDVNTPHAYSQWPETATLPVDEPELLIYNLLDFDPDTALATGKIVWFERAGAVWRRGEEWHRQRAHTRADIEGALAGAGLQPLACLDRAGNPAQDASTTRAIWVCRNG